VTDKLNEVEAPSPKKVSKTTLNVAGDAGALVQLVVAELYVYITPLTDADCPLTGDVGNAII
jgi:hypothetical protein